jgi:hypothetical protein
MKQFLKDLLHIVVFIFSAYAICVIIVDVLDIQVSTSTSTHIQVFRENGYTCITMNQQRGATCTKDSQ